MSKESETLMDAFIRDYSGLQQPQVIKVDPNNRMEVCQITDSIIDMFKEKGMTYAEAHAILNFTIDVLKYKSQFVGM